MDKKKMSKKGTRVVKRLLAAVCMAALVLGLVPNGIGASRVLAADSVAAYDLKVGCTYGEGTTITDAGTSKLQFTSYAGYQAGKEEDDFDEIPSDESYTTSELTLPKSCTTKNGTIGNGQWVYGGLNGDNIIFYAPKTKTSTTTTLFYENRDLSDRFFFNFSVTFGETWELTAQAKAGNTDVTGATVVYYSDEECKTKLEDVPTAVGTYYARGEYAGNDNYEASNSDLVVMVTIEEKTPEKGVDYDYTMAELLEKGTTKLAAGTKIYLDKPIARETRFGGTYEYGVGYGMLTDDRTKIKNYGTYVEQAGCIKDASDEVSAGTIITLDNSYVFNYYNDDGESLEATITGKEWYFVVIEIGDDEYGFSIMPTSPTEGYINDVIAPTISDDGQPTDASVKVGETATFTVTATGDELTYQWLIDRNDGKGFVNIDGATATSYATSAVDTSCDGYKYHCIVTNTAGSITTNDVTLTVTSDESEVHKHTLVHYDEVAATTTTPGTKEYWQCSDCGKCFSDADGENEINAPETIPVIKPDTPVQHTHTLVYHAEVAATTIKAGTKAYWQCSDCGKYFSDAEGKTGIEKPEIIPIIAAKDDGSDKGSDNGSDATTTTTTTETTAADTTGTTASGSAAANTAAASDSPKTGDSTPLVWAFVLLLGSAAGLFGISGFRAARREK